jgi:outer membrane protein W
MKKTFFFCFLLISSLVKAQYNEFGITGGGMFYSGDLSHTVSGTLAETHPTVGLFIKHNFGDFVALHGQYNYGTVSGRDKYATEEDLLNRNLSFRSTIHEFGVQVEYNIGGYQPYALYKTFSPYVFLGINGVLFNPTTRYNNEWIALAPLQTEGKAYRKLGFALPIGGGVKYALNDTWNLGAYFSWRPMFTDYLDDVSGKYISKTELALQSGATAAELGNKIDAATGTKRGDDRKFDMYHILGVSISYNFTDNGLIGVRKRVRGRSGCKQSNF